MMIVERVRSPGAIIKIEHVVFIINNLLAGTPRPRSPLMESFATLLSFTSPDHFLSARCTLKAHPRLPAQEENGCIASPSPPNETHEAHNTLVSRYLAFQSDSDLIACYPESSISLC